MSIKCIFPNFDIGDQRSGQFCDLSMKCEWEKIEKRLFWTKTILNTLSLKHQVTGRIDNLNWKIATSAPLHDPKVTSGHERSLTVSRKYLTFDRDKLNE